MSLSCFLNIWKIPWVEKEESNLIGHRQSVGQPICDERLHRDLCIALRDVEAVRQQQKKPSSYSKQRRKLIEKPE